jgi:hypothetical protein
MDNSNKNKTVKPNPEQRRPTQQEQQDQKNAQQGGEGGRPAQSEQSQGDRKESDRRPDKRDIDSMAKPAGTTATADRYTGRIAGKGSPHWRPLFTCPVRSRSAAPPTRSAASRCRLIRPGYGS